MALDVAKHIKSRFGHLFEDVCRFIIRPDRASYTIDDLGPSLFRLGEGLPAKYKRSDLELVNMRGMSIKCSWFEPFEGPPPGSAALPCVVYLHGNCGCRWDGLEILFLLKHGFTLFVYDACGSGHSDGEFVSLGFYERQDLATVLEYLHSQPARVRSIGLWGRSMGAVTSIMYASKDPSIQCIVCDSPFASLKTLCKDLVEQHGSWVPGGVVSLVVKKIRKRISKMAGFDIFDLDCTKYARHCDVPAFMFHGEKDTFVQPHHSIAVEQAYRGSCLHKLVRGDHNSKRGEDALETAVAFLQLYLVDKVNAGPKQQQQHKKKKSSCTADAMDDGAQDDPSLRSSPALSGDDADATQLTTGADGGVTATSTTEALGDSPSSRGTTTPRPDSDIESGDDDDLADEVLLEQLTAATMTDDASAAAIADARAQT